jgi:4-amino-4-deoxy-L-arabinose transferase-like glycosyltransferase
MNDPNVPLEAVTLTDTASVEPAASNSRWPTYVVLFFTFAALLVRLALLLVDGSLWKPIVADELQFYGLGASLATGHGFSLDGFDVINRMPGYPSLLALVYLITGPSMEWARLLNVLLGTLCVPLIYLVGKQVWGVRIGLAAAGALAFDPFSIFWPQFVLSENLQILLVTLLGVLLISAKQSVLRAQAIGLVAALSILTHPGTVPIVAAAFLWYWFYARSLRVPFRHYFYIGLTFLLVMSFWWVRNWLLVGGFVPLTAGVEASGGGFVFWISNNELTAQPGEYWGSFIPAKEYAKMPDFEQYNHLASPSAIELDHKGYEYGLKFLTSHPDEVPMLLVGKVVKFWEPRVITRDAEVIVLPLAVMFVPLYILGLVLHWRRSLKARMVVAFVAGALLLSLIYWGGARFRASVESYLVLALVVAVVQIVVWVRQLWTRRVLADPMAAEQS